MSSDLTAFTDALSAALNAEIRHTRRLGGGDFAESYLVTLADASPVFAKTHRNPPPNFFSTEAAGLEWLRATGTVPTPTVLAVSDGPPAFLALEWIEPGSPRHTTDADFGAALAALHRTARPSFGRPDGRTTGSQGLPNGEHLTWSSFYRENRLLPLARIGADRDCFSPGAAGRLETLAGRLDLLGVPDEPPTLLHGDLWAGNRIVDANGTSWLIDPAAHAGHREFDLGMMLLFGGFDDCFDAYQDAHRLEPGWQDRAPLHQLAPLAVHAIKFGGGYVRALDRAIDASMKLG